METNYQEDVCKYGNPADLGDEKYPLGAGIGTSSPAWLQALNTAIGRVKPVDTGKRGVKRKRVNRDDDSLDEDTPSPGNEDTPPPGNDDGMRNDDGASTG